jgi:hypothetical protein
MDTSQIVNQLTAERDRIDEVIKLLSAWARPGRPPKATTNAADNSVAIAAPTKGTRKKRKPLSTEARKRIGDAQRKRWARAAKQKKGA